MRLLRGLGALLGAALIGYGVYGMLHDPYIQRPMDVLRWVAAGLVLHDGVWLPLVMLLGALVSRAMPAPIADLLRGALVIAAATTAIALPGMLRAHADPGGNTTVAPLDYQRHWVVLMAVLGAGSALAAAYRWVRRGRARARGRSRAAAG